MTHTMPALVLNGPGDVQVAEKPIPTPGPGEVVLAVEATTICGTDLRIISGEKTAGVRPGVTLGHEIAGRIASLGEGVEGLVVGQQATISIVVSCGTSWRGEPWGDCCHHRRRGYRPASYRAQPGMRGWASHPV